MFDCFLEDEQDPPLCPSCGRWWDPTSERCEFSHQEDAKLYASNVRAAIERERLKNQALQARNGGPRRW